MTEYGRGAGSEPWHPEDPLYGDQGWGAQQAAPGQAQYGEQQPHQQYAQQQNPQHQQYQQNQQHPQHQNQQQYAQQPQDPYGQQHYGEQPQQGYPQEQYVQQQAQYNAGWDTTGQQAAMPYAGQQPEGFPGYGTETQDHYGTPEAYPPPQPPGQRRAVPEQAPEWAPEEELEKETHPFFSDGGDEPDSDEDEPRGSRRGGGGRDRRGGKGKKKGKSGRACLVLVVVFSLGVGGAGYFGYQFWQKKFGAAPDYVGTGSTPVQVEIPQGAGGYEIGSILAKAGVVKSQGAFVSAQNDNPKGKTLQAGVYTLNKGMSAANAVAAMLNPASRSNFIIPEGKRNAWVYEQIDKRLELKPGTTKDVAKAQAKNLGLPDWANDNKEIADPLEGFLYPASYPVAKGAKPEDVLRKMVSRANQEYGKADLKGMASKLGLKSPLQVLTVASLVQAEGKYKHDFDKVARVVYNRLKPNNTETYGLLDFDSTVNYAKSESTLDTGAVKDLRHFKHPYNTYYIHGLPPGPIGNPGESALHSALNPTPGPWYYFVSVTENETLFAVTNEEHEQNRKKYEKEKSGQ
ncbi:endolytic transglycosylase MltG [Streptomyces sp. BPTC-684]|uniref:endolytic transglycosylase MltG n=1 Tax=Streptomyces sp. BPTC-684 TaxID=3043734 RepID=UPI0024B135C1|nr:endolytic transglycosylase MltG [Streptomyces sp. BPTC-684]WHM39678.1 endolytic transglycosylase MltG [Streptomyces sp. BPTC-684]